MNIKEPLYVTAIAREGSLSKAAAALGISQPTLSVFLSNLEDDLGIELFLREKKRLIPTPAGNIYIDAAKQIINIKNLTYQAIFQTTHEVAETILIGATPLRGSIMIAQVHHDFNAHFPNVQLKINESYMNDLRKNVLLGHVNLALGSCYDTEDPDYDYVTVSREEVVLAVPAFHPLAHLARTEDDSLASIDIKEFSNTPFVLLSPGTTIRRITDYIFDKAGFTPTVVFESNNNLVINNMVKQGSGVGFIPYSFIDQNSEDVVYFSLEPNYYIYLSIILKKGKKLSEAEQYLTYLIIKKDRFNPQYSYGMNALAEKIYKKFDTMNW